MDNMTTKARAELRAISIKIQELAERKTALEKFLTIYAELSDSPPAEGQTSTAAGTMTVKARIAAAAVELLADGRHMHTRELLDELEKLGIEVGGKDTVQALSAILSQDTAKRFIPDRRFGWSLKKSSPGAVPAAPEALFQPGD